MSETHSAILHCPYCAEEDLRPHEDSRSGHGAWICAACRRVFAVRLIGIAPVATTASSAATATPASTASPGGVR